MIDMVNDLNLELMLSSAIAKNDAEEQASQNQHKLRLTRGCYEKIMTYAALTSRITNTGMECYGYLLREKWKPGDLITQVYFANDQLVSSSYVQVTQEGVRKALNDVANMDCDIVGWWHSHGSFNVFHSSTDVENFKNVLHGISPDTIFSYQEAPYIVDPVNRRVVIGDVALTDLSEQEIEVFEQRRIQSYKKGEQQPFAFSLVVNNNRDTYREKITKSKHNGRFVVDTPTHPQLDINDVSNDLDFLIADLEWEIREKIILRDGRNKKTGQTKNNSQIEELADDFMTKIDSYGNQDGIYTDLLQSLFIQGENPAERLVLEKKGVKSPNAKELLIAYISEMPESTYNNWDASLNIFERQHFIMRSLIESIAVSAEKNDRIDEIVQKHKNMAGYLQCSFEVADPVMKALTKYAMELTTDYKHEAHHQYKKFIGTVLTDVVKGKSWIQAVNCAIHATTKRQRNELFIWEDRFAICNELLLEGYNHHASVSSRAAPFYPTETFLRGFQDAYQNNPKGVDVLIESFLQQNGVSKKKLVKYQDANYDQIRYQKKERKLPTIAPAEPLYSKWDNKLKWLKRWLE